MEAASGIPTIPGYRLIKKIGQGASGTVWLAEEPLSSRKVAVKILPKSAEGKQNIGRELNGIRQFQQIARGHHDIVQILKLDETEDCCYYSMELADDAATSKPLTSSDGDASTYVPLTLKHVISAEAPLDPERALDIITHILRGLDHLHARKLIHRDVKPANILFVNERPELGDLGLVTPSDREVTQVGTPGYMPPGAKVDKTSDLYAAGIVLYEMITGLRGSDFPTLSGRRFKTDAKTRAFQIANDTVKRSVRPLAGDRFQSARDMLEHIENARSGTARNRKLLITASLVVILGLLIAVGGAQARKYFVANRPESSPSIPRAITSRQLSYEEGGAAGTIQVGYSDGAAKNHKFPTPTKGVVVGEFSPGKTSIAVGFEGKGPDSGKLEIFDAADFRATDNPMPIFEETFCDNPPAAWDFQDHPLICAIKPQLAVDLDGIPGDELVIAALHDDGPCEVIIMKPNGRKIGSFWHYGWLTAVRADDLDSDGKRELICSGVANWRESPTPFGRRSEVLHSCIMVLRPESLESTIGYWGPFAWMCKDSKVAPSAYGYLLPGQSRDDRWDMKSCDVFHGPNGPTIRARLSFDLFLDLNADLTPIRALFEAYGGQRNATPPPVDEIWKRTWPSDNSRKTLPPHSHISAISARILPRASGQKSSEPSPLNVLFDNGREKLTMFSTPPTAALVGRYQTNESFVAVGFGSLGPLSGSIAIYDANELWESLSPKATTEQRVCEPPPAQWGVGKEALHCALAPLLAVDLDGIPGDELCLTSNHDNGCSELIIMKPGGEILGRFWHHGWIDDVRAADLDGDDQPELVCRAWATRRSSPPPGDSSSRPDAKSLFTLSPREVMGGTGHWGLNEWMKKDSRVTPRAYGYFAEYSDYSLEIVGGQGAPIIRVTLGNSNSYIDLRWNLSPIKVGYFSGSADRSKPLRSAAEIWTRTWPPDPDSAKDSSANGE